MDELTDDELLAEARERLTRRADELRATIAQIETATAPVAPDNAIGRLTRVDAMQATAMRMAMSHAHEAELRQVERALRAVSEGTYGRCRRCNERISAIRLRARPEAVFCLRCAEPTAR